MKYYRFTTWPPRSLEEVMRDKIPSAMLEYDNGNKKPFRDLEIVTREDFYKIGGWMFDLKPYLKRYWVKEKYYGIQEYFAVNKTAIRKELKSRCIKIIEVK